MSKRHGGSDSSWDGDRTLIFECWQAPDRDSPRVAEFDVVLGEQLHALLQMEGRGGTREEDVREVTGVDISRPRRWHKIFERMGLVFLADDGTTHLTDLGRRVLKEETTAATGFRRRMAASALTVLGRYQLKNPADETIEDHYPDDCDIHPYWAIWRACLELDNKLHWDELNREIFRVLRHDQLPAAIDRIKRARSSPGYDPVQGGSSSVALSARCYEQTSAPAGRSPEGQIRDQKATPWFRRAGFGGLLLRSPEREGEGYWSIPDDVVDLVQDATSATPPYLEFESKAEWFAYFGALDGAAPEIEDSQLAQLDRLEPLVDLLIRRKNIVFYGPPGTGKTVAALKIAKWWEQVNGEGSVARITFHPSYGYEDFVQGFRPQRDRPGEFALQPGILLEMIGVAERFAATRASGEELRKALILIDEINRGDVARILGELITYIERDKRGVPFVLSQSPDTQVAIPGNLYVLGTMNTADKSISLLDVALRRRFAFVEFPPNPASYAEIPGWLEAIEGIPLSDLLTAINQRLVDAGVDPDRSIGHALLAVDVDSPNPLAILRERFEYDLLPLVGEYVYNDRSRVAEVLGPLSDGQARLGGMDDQAFLENLRTYIRTTPGGISGNQGRPSLPPAPEESDET